MAPEHRVNKVRAGTSRGRGCGAIPQTEVVVLGSDAAIQAANAERGGFLDVTKVL
jgi:hypothetical protein